MSAGVRGMFGRVRRGAFREDEAAIREELFGPERLEQHAQSLATAQEVTRRPGRGRSLSTRLRANERVLLDAHRAIGVAISEGEAISPAAEWLVDNYHVIEAQIAEIRNDLPPDYYRQLPKLSNGPFAGYPRVFGIAWAYVAHTDSRVEPDGLRTFVLAYQGRQPLTIGELWAVAITLRVVLIENLRRAAARIVHGREARRVADSLANRLLADQPLTPSHVARLLARHSGRLPGPFAVRLVQRLRDQDPHITPALAWLDDRLVAQGTSADETVHDEQQREGAANVTVRNIITSMRLVSDIDWRALVESMSLVDATLTAGSAFAAMDFRSRNLYRSAIEELARGSALSELEITRAAVRAATNAIRIDAVGGAAASPTATPGDDRRQDPGYHLIGAGRAAFERAIGFRSAPHRWLERAIVGCGVWGYMGVVFATIAILLVLPLAVLSGIGIDLPLLALLAVLGVVPATDAATALVNRAVVRGVGPTTLPGLALREGIPARLRTLVAVPMLLDTVAAIEEQVAQLAVHHLSNPDAELHFALVADWPDAPAERMPEDARLLDAAVTGIARLNRECDPGEGGGRFFLLHRRRTWSAGQDCWMGWERKRGKLHELNRLLRGATDTTFLDPPALPTGFRYVITLDADTRLPRDAARRLIGKMAHPLNRPRFDAQRQRIVEGYGVLQPRVAPSLPVGREGSLFQRVFSSASGMDPYAGAVSDVYQDLFGEGSFTGKGIYDIDAFEASLRDRVPEGVLLSHDLFEGAFARAGLVSDVEVVEAYPARYDVAAGRQHRWARGDWQLLPWITGRVSGSRARGLSALDRWKMLDNLRRSISAPAATAALVAGWLLPLPAAALWTAFILATIGVTTLLPLLSSMVPRRSGVTVRSYLRALQEDVRLATLLSALAVTFLAHQAWSMADAITRALYRMGVTRQRLLDWTTSAQATIGPRHGLLARYWSMHGSLVVVLGGTAVLWLAGGAAWPVAVPLLVAWMLAPAIAGLISRPPAAADHVPVRPIESAMLRGIARSTWRYFEMCVTTTENMLPPDNLQVDPESIIAHRTSPTNVGLYLLSIAGARDFGWIGTTEATERIELTLATLSRMQRFRGHFLNWYDTRDLRPLDPQYVSTVDSGNLAGHLIALAGACDEWRRGPASEEVRQAGVRDALALARTALDALPDNRRTQTVAAHQLTDTLDALHEHLGHTSDLEASDHAAVLREATIAADIAHALANERGDVAGEDVRFWTDAILGSLASQARDAPWAPDLESRLDVIAAQARSLAEAMAFGFLVDPERQLLSIGYQVAEARRDPSCYDLLASEARLSSFLAIAKGDVRTRHWFRLGRTTVPAGSGAALTSWSGSMFEYLMPSLVMRAPAGSLLEMTNRLAVHEQIRHGRRHRMPWGVSESAYNARDLEMTYQYASFGLPRLGLRRDLDRDLVVAPYATALAAMVDPQAATVNFARLEAIGARGRMGFHEAVDFTRRRVPEGRRFAVVRSYMAHHQGMVIVALANVLFDGCMRTRFHAEPQVRATELLLQERSPRDVAIARARVTDTDGPRGTRVDDVTSMRRAASAHDTPPQAHLLSNGRYAVMLTGAGSGYSRWDEFDISRWREDVTRDDHGAWIYLRDVQSGRVWSAGHQPVGATPDQYAVLFAEDRAEFTRQDGSFTTTLDVLVSPEHPAEVRRVSIANTGHRSREIEVTSYMELVLAPAAADLAHPAFSKLFVQTEYLARWGALVATRRRRAPGEREIWAAHLAIVEGEPAGQPELETDRARFLGRGHETRAPVAVIDGRPLSGTVGTVLDPVFALRRRVRIAPGRTARIAFWTLVADTRDALVDLIDKHQDATAFARVSTLAWTQAQVQLGHLGIDVGQALLFQRLAGHLLHADATLRPAPDVIRRGAGPQQHLWSHGISGDLPMVLVRIDGVEDLAIVRQILQAHAYWRLRQLAVDVVIVNERGTSYMQDLQQALEVLVRTSQVRTRDGHAEGTRGEVFLLRGDLLPASSRALLLAMARVVLTGRGGALSQQMTDAAPVMEPAPRAKRRAPPTPPRGSGGAVAPPRLAFNNGFGGFSDDGREYIVHLQAGRTTPAPWINVIANPDFGFQVSAEGTGYTWAGNSRENQLTPWSNDPVSDRPGEVVYLRDEESGEVWSPTASPFGAGPGTHVAAHGAGYSRFEHSAGGIGSVLLQTVPLDDPVKISWLTLRNEGSRPRRLSVTVYVEWVLGPSRSAAALSMQTSIDTETGALFACNPWHRTRGAHMAFLDGGGAQTQWTGDRREFIGRNGTLADPAALAPDTVLSGRTGAGLDACGALRVVVTLPPGEMRVVTFVLGQASSTPEARLLVARYREASQDAVMDAIDRHWNDVLGTVQVRTPDPALDLMLNRWLLYQTLACRVWARSAFYQASGAYGFRDQLQDGMALVVTRPDLTREHLLRAAGRQFVEGDVQHWWLPPTGTGVRTRIADDRCWLALAAAHYIEWTGDDGVLDAIVPFLEGPALRAGEAEAFFDPLTSDESATLFEHCARALDASLDCGPHGLPLFGGGDWNDGMNRVGAGGVGESVWLGWFLASTLARFVPIAALRGDDERAQRWATHTTALRVALDASAWDGGWYLRGWYDDGTALGSSASDECRIDAIAQAWAVLDGGGDPERARRSMNAVFGHLVREDDGVAPLFTPPFDRTSLDPGYIRGYPPGVRENGGQYTHAAAWSVMAFARLGDGDRAMGLLSMLNPIRHAGTRADVQRYKVEPYVVAADIYSVAPHIGRGGWTWYTGSAGWLYRAGLESILGLRRVGPNLVIEPCVPRAWPAFSVVYRHGSARYRIDVVNPHGVSNGVATATVDGTPIDTRPVTVPLVDDGQVHDVRINLGPKATRE